MSETQADFKPNNRAERRAGAAKKRGKAGPHGGDVVERDLTTFGSLQLIWEPELARVLCRSRYTLKRWVERGLLPPPLRIAEGLAWRVADIEAALDRLGRARRKPKHRGKLMQGKQLVKV